MARYSEVFPDWDAFSEYDKPKVAPKADREPGELMVKCNCPCCGAELSVEYGDDEGEIAVVGCAK